MTAITEDMTTDQAFEDYVQRLTKKALLCRVQGHKIPDLDDRRRVRPHFEGEIRVLQADCVRRCGCYITIYIDENGFIPKQRRSHWYDKNVSYLIPKEARNGKGLTKEMKARMRQEFLIRNADWITED